jgi:LysR family transcriptional activator of dmlA
MRIDDVTNLRCFKLIYESRSLTKASQELGLSKAAVSKRLDSLETNLGYKLFFRNTRKISPSKEADSLILTVREILEKLDKLGHSSSQKESVTRIRMTCISSMASSFLGMLLRDFQKTHPEFIIDLVVTDSILDPLENNIDLSIRINPPKNSPLIGRILGPFKLSFVASPDYLKKQKKLRSFEDLAKLEFISIDHHLNALNTFGKEWKTKVLANRRLITNDSQLVNQLLVSGEGVGLRANWDTKKLIHEKKLQFALAEDLIKPQGEVWILSSQERLKSAAVRKLYDFLIKEIPAYL